MKRKTVYDKMANDRLIMIALAELLAWHDTGASWDLTAMRSALHDRATNENNSINITRRMAGALVEALMVRPGRKLKKKP